VTAGADSPTCGSRRSRLGGRGSRSPRATCRTA
jgi:hypothetical protein